MKVGRISIEINNIDDGNVKQKRSCGNRNDRRVHRRVKSSDGHENVGKAVNLGRPNIGGPYIRP